MRALYEFQWLLSLVSLFASLVCCTTVVSLSSLQWTLHDALSNTSVPGKVPSLAQLDLLAAGKIQEPTYNRNDHKTIWVGLTNWTYTSQPIKNLNSTKDVSTYLVFQGVDTVANVSFCNQTIGSVKNAFRQWTFDVSEALQSCTAHPVLQVAFTNAATAANNAELANPCASCLGIKYNLPNRQYIRKASNDFGWDWAPQLLPQGIWQDGSIIQIPKTTNSILINNSFVDIYRRGQLNNLPPDQSAPWIMNISIQYLGHVPPSTTLRARILDTKGSIFVETDISNTRHANGFITGSMTIYSEPELWWPVGYGDQPLYNVFIDVLQQPSKAVIGSVQKRVGFRTIVLNQAEFTKVEISKHKFYKGAKWLFEVNGHEIYVKGSNFVPQDPLWPRITIDQLDSLFKAALAANQNMIRVWASGSYLPDYAFHLADEYGLMIWSEFEFTDGIYPTDEAFVQNVEEEVHYQIRRTNHHPSLALWCGNNEIQYGIAAFKAAGVPEPPAAMKNFKKLFMDVILHAVYQNTRSISYLPSSVNYGYISLNHSASQPMVERYDPKTVSEGYLYGNSDYYNYDTTQTLNESAFPIARFGVEFGFHSHSPYLTYKANMPESELAFESKTILHRNHHFPPQYLPANLLAPVGTRTRAMSRQGIQEMSMGAELFYPEPAHGTSSHPLFALQIYATQIFQAEWVRTQVEFYRRGSGLPERNMGSLYWQLNEIWAAPTWAGIAVDGRWKPLHYVIKDVYEPVIVAPYVTEAGIFSAYATSDLWDIVSGTASMKWYDWSGKQIHNSVWSFTRSFSVGAINSTRLFSKDLADLPKELKNAVALLTVQAKDAKGKTFTSQREYHPTLLSKPSAIAAMKDPELSLSYDKNKGVFTVHSRAVATFVWLEHPSNVAGYWSTNAFWMLPGTKEITFVATGSLPSGWWNNVTVMSMWDLIQK